ncbi:hypothetical protein [Mesorhizobium sp. B2-3-10]|uniref:hypothetical protein n=1 Tax=Mesorhizobium sp. B2-3-10 TaxID=2589954 RepID=UPI00112DB765|nr:hypothetical protein [Mesorhizobium sp. B2-3-10]TPL94761.1 hypothetical protein FJ943_25080 [Mesorhizobium sp. B2-3-10]
MILEFYFEAEPHPAVYDIYLDKDGVAKPAQPKPEPIDGIRQFVLEGSTFTTGQMVAIQQTLELRPHWEPHYFTEDLPF